VSDITRSLFCVAVALATPRAGASQNHTVNSQFNASLAGWTLPVPNGYSRNWTDARGAAAPGAAAIYANGSKILGATPLEQCVGVVEGAKYVLSLDFRYEAGFGTAERAYFELEFYTDGSCGGTQLSAFAPAAVTSTDAAYASTWQHLSVPITGMSGASSLLVSVNVTTSVAADAQGYVDDVAFRGGTSGDANGNGIVDVADVFYLINYLFAGGPLPKGPVDVNNSDSVDVEDVFYLINSLFAGGPLPL
jgi:hypothetical protein